MRGSNNQQGEGCMKLIIVAILLSIITGFAFGMAYEYEVNYEPLYNEIWYPDKPPEGIDVELALQYLTRARLSHQYYLDNPDKMKDYMTVENQQGCVDRYNAVMDLLLRLDDDTGTP